MALDPDRPILLPDDPDFWDPWYWGQMVGVQDKHTREIIPFNLWPHQLVDRAAIRRAYAENKWIGKLKPRRVGGSALYASVLTQHTCFRRGAATAIVSFKREHSKEIARMCARTYKTIPDALRPRRNVKVTVGLDLPDIESYLTIASAKDDEPFRGSGLAAALADEISSWGMVGALDTWVALRNAVDEETGFLAAISTPRYDGDPMHQVWKEGELPDSKWIRVFTPWTQIQEYAVEPPPGWRIGEKAQAYREKYSITDDQAYWLDKVALPKCAGSIDKFRAEYPINSTDPWTIRGDSIFDLAVLNRRVEGLGLTGAEGETDECVVIAGPERGHKYVIACDPAGSWSKRDFWAVEIIDLYECRQVFEWRGHATAFAMANNLIRWSQEYNAGNIYVERNGVGEACLSHLEVSRYGRVYYDPAGKPGWWSGAKSKAEAVGYLQELVDDGSLGIFTVRALKQLMQYTGGWTEAGASRSSADDRDSSGGHFDLVAALSIGAWAWRNEGGAARARYASVDQKNTLQRWLKHMMGMPATGLDPRSRFGVHR